MAIGKRGGLVDTAADLVHDPLRDLEQVLFVAELDRGEHQLALLFDIGLLRPIDHDVRHVGIGEQFLERTEAQQLVDQHLFERELFAPVERDLELGQHFQNDRAEFFGQLVLGQRGGGFRIDAFEQAGKHLFLDLVDARFEPADLRTGVVDRVHAVF